MILLVAMPGGYVDRSRVKRYDSSASRGGSSTDTAPPGVETLWKGLQRLRDLAWGWGWETFGPVATP